MLAVQDVRDLRRYTVERVAPGEARNALVPRGQAVYAHYLNRQKFAAEIEAAKASVLHATDGEAEVERQRARDERLLKKLRNMRLVCCLAPVPPCQNSVSPALWLTRSARRCSSQLHARAQRAAPNLKQISCAG